jgi:hypothetical protein
MITEEEEGMLYAKMRITGGSNVIILILAAFIAYERWMPIAF